jgi:uncharacterized membrane protein YfcA
MNELIILLIVSLTFFAAGGIKGVVGLGLPTFSLGLLAISFDLVTAIVLTIIPSLVTNLWQAFSGTPVRQILQRIWPFLLLALATIWLGAYTLATLDTYFLTLLLGTLLIAYALISLLGIHFTIPPRHRGWTGACLGTLNGALTGMAGVYIVPSVMYFQAIGMRREELVTAMGILFSLSSISMLLAYRYQELLTVQQAMLSLFAVIPALIGMYVGQRIRQLLAEATFKKLLFITLFFLGLLIIIRNI